MEAQNVLLPEAVSKHHLFMRRRHRSRAGQRGMLCRASVGRVGGGGERRVNNKGGFAKMENTNWG